jgi:HlyD family secretion protein
MKRWQRWSLVVVGAVAVIALLRFTVLRPKPIPVEVVAVSRGVVEDAVTNSQAGTVMSRQRSRVGAERAGRVVRIPHREGAMVKQGELLVLLDTSTSSTRLDLARREMQVAEATVAAARAGFDLAKADFERTSSLFEQNVVSQGEMDQAKSGYERAQAELAAAEAGIARARANVQLAQDDLDHMRVVAPFDGTVAQRLVEVGESVIPGQPVLEVVALNALYVSARIDEVDIGRLRDALPARVTLDPYRGEVWMGEVARVFPVVDDRLEQNRTLEVEVDIHMDASKPQPKPGTSADVVIVIDKREAVLRVPTFAVMEGKRVLVARKGKAVEHDIVTGLKNWEWTEVLEGVAEGDQVITSVDRQGVREGALVKPASPEGRQDKVAGARS